MRLLSAFLLCACVADMPHEQEYNCKGVKPNRALLYHPPDYTILPEGTDLVVKAWLWTHYLCQIAPDFELVLESSIQDEIEIDYTIQGKEVQIFLEEDLQPGEHTISLLSREFRVFETPLDSTTIRIIENTAPRVFFQENTPKEFFEDPQMYIEVFDVIERLEELELSWTLNDAVYYGPKRPNEDGEVEIVLEGLTPGHYTLQVTVKDIMEQAATASISFVRH